MKKIDPSKLSKADLNRLGAAAEAVTYESTRRLTAQDRRELGRAARQRTKHEDRKHAKGYAGAYQERI